MIAATFIVAALVSSCVSPGTKIRVVTNEPAEDLVVECRITKDYLIAHNATSYTVIDKHIVAKSDEDISCGLLVAGSRSGAWVYHPTLQNKIRDDNAKKKYTDSGAEIRELITWREKNILALELYERGHWDHMYDPLDTYLSNISYCGISKGYLENYNEDEKPDYIELKSKYYKEIVECNRQRELIRHEHGRSSDFFYYGKTGHFGEQLMSCAFHRTYCRTEKEYRPERTLESRTDYMWGRKMWDPYLSGSDEDRDLLTGKIKKTFIVAYDLPYMMPRQETWKSSNGQPAKLIVIPARPSNSNTNHVWLYASAYSREDFTEHFDRRLTVFDVKPTWLSEYDEDSFIKNCNADDLHIDIYALSKEQRNSLYRSFHKIVNGQSIDSCINNIE